MGIAIGVGVGVGFGGITGAGAALQRGWISTYDAGSVGDYYVSKSGSDANNGFTLGTAKLTIQAAVTAARVAGGQKAIKVVGNGTKYRETVDLTSWLGSSGAKNSLTGYGTDKPVITGGDVVTGWTQCTSADSSTLGATLGVNGSPVYKVTVARSAIGSTQLLGINLCEADVQVPMCYDRLTTGNPLSQNDEALMYTATSATTDGNGNFASWTHAAVFGGYTTTQLNNAWISFFYYSNRVAQAKITSSSSTTVNVTLAASPARAPDAAYNYGLLNILPKLVSGSFGFIDNGNSTITLFLYPTSVGNLTSNIEICGRTNAITGINCGNLKIEGFELARVGSDTAVLYLGGSGTNAITGLEVRHVKARQTAGAFGLYVFAPTSSLMEYVTVTDIYSTNAGGLCQGISFQDLSSNTVNQGNIVRYADIERIEQSPLQFYTQINTVFAYSLMKDSCIGAHANLFNAYLTSNGTMFWGLEVVNCPGAYSTWQDNYSGVFGMNCIDEPGGYAFRDQAHQTFPGSPATTTNYYVNNVTKSSIEILPLRDAGQMVATNNAYNNILNILAKRNASSIDLWDAKNNLYMTTTANDVSNQAGLGTSGPFEIINTTAGAVLNAGDLRLASGSAAIGMGGKNLDTQLAAWETQYGMSFHKDVLGQPFTTLSFVGCYASAYVPDVTAPTINTPSISVTGSATMTVGATTTEANGGLYWVLTTSATPPSAAQIVAGKDNTGATASASGLIANGSSAGAKTGNASGLTSSTLYYLYILHQDLAGNNSNIVTTSATTNSAVTGVRVQSLGSYYNSFVSTANISVPALAAGDICIICIEMIFTVNSTFNSVPAGWTQLGGGWNGTNDLPSIQGVSSKPSIWTFVHTAASAEGATTFPFIPTGGSVAVTASVWQIRGDTAISVFGSNGSVSTAQVTINSVPNNSGCLTVFSNFVGSGSVTSSATEAATFGVPDTPAFPSTQGVWQNTFSASSHCSYLGLMFRKVGTGNYTQPNKTSGNWCEYTIIIQP